MAKNQDGRTGWYCSIAAALTAGVMLLQGCASMPSRTAAPGAASADVCPGSEYKIGPGDELEVFVFNEKDLSGVVPVRPDGFISMPLIDRIPASGKTPSELSHDIAAKLKDYIRAPQVNVIVTRFVGTLDEQIRVVGQGIDKPVALPYKRGTKPITPSRVSVT